MRQFNYGVYITDAIFHCCFGNATPYISDRVCNETRMPLVEKTWVNEVICGGSCTGISVRAGRAEPYPREYARTSRRSARDVPKVALGRNYRERAGDHPDHEPNALQVEILSEGRAERIGFLRLL